MRSAEPRCLVLTLYSGENEFEASRAALVGQRYRHHEQRVFEGLPNKEAHRRLYEEIMRRAEEFQLFLKLDADMVFVDDGALDRIVRFFAERPDLDHAMFALHDYLTDGPLWGMHAFSSRVRWEPDDEALFVDPDPTVPGRRLVVRGEPGPVAHHAPDPAPYQAFHFGVHRGLKAFQPERRRFNHDQALKQWELLTRVWDHFERNPDPRLGLAVLGADLVWRGELTSAGEAYDDPALIERFDACKALDADALRERLGGRWSAGLSRTTRWAASVGPRVAKSVVASKLSTPTRGSE